MLVDRITERPAALCALSITQSSRFEPGGIEPVLRIHVPEGLEVDPDEIEAALADLGEVPRLEAALRRVVPDRIVAEHVDAAVEGRKSVSRSSGCRLCDAPPSRRWTKSGEDRLQHAQLLPELAPGAA